MSFTKAVAELVVEEGSLEVAETTGGSSVTALATVSSGRLSFSHCGRDGHTADRCFHNPACSYYRKDIRTDVGKRNQRKTKSFGNQKRKPKNESSHDKDNVANVALMSKSVLHGNVLATSAMKKKWMIDSASTSHICNNEMHFESLTKQPRRPVEVGEGQHVVVAGIGNVRGAAVVDGKQHEVVMKDVLYVPTMICNLISVSKERRSGFYILFDGERLDDGFCKIVHKESGQVFVHGKELSEGLYDALFRPKNMSRALVTSSVKQQIWHKRLGHASTGVMAKTLPIAKGIGLDKVKQASDEICENC